MGERGMNLYEGILGLLGISFFITQNPYSHSSSTLIHSWKRSCGLIKALPKSEWVVELCGYEINKSCTGGGNYIALTFIRTKRQWMNVINAIYIPPPIHSKSHIHYKGSLFLSFNSWIRSCNRVFVVGGPIRRPNVKELIEKLREPL